ncbi:MAG: DUF2066 domain-containing protein [Gammaproteobacteria bacterium]
MRKIIAAIILCFACAASAAVRIPIYSVSVPVASESSQDRDKALKTAFQDVVVKVTGEKDAADNSVVNNAMKTPDHYIQQYDYDRAESDDGISPLILQVTFYPSTMKSLLRDADLPFWGADRPVVFLYLIVDTPDEKVVVTSENNPDLVESIKQLSEKRGLPITFPAAINEDTEQMQLEDIQALAQQCHANAILIGHISMGDNDPVDSQWNFYFAQQHHQWQDESPTILSGLTDALSQTTQMLSQRFAIKFNEEEGHTFSMVIENINSTQDYAKVLSYLKHITQVKLLTLKQAASSQIQVDLSITGSEQHFLDVLSLDGKLIPDDQEDKVAYIWMNDQKG